MEVNCSTGPASAAASSSSSGPAVPSSRACVTVTETVTVIAGPPLPAEGLFPQRSQVRPRNWRTRQPGTTPDPLWRSASAATDQQVSPSVTPETHGNIRTLKVCRGSDDISATSQPSKRRTRLCPPGRGSPPVPPGVTSVLTAASLPLEINLSVLVDPRERPDPQVP